MSQRVVFAYPGDLDLKTGGYGYDRQVIQGLRNLGWEVDTIGLGHGFPAPSAAVLENAERTLSALRDGTCVIIDGLAFGTMGAWAQRERDRLAIIALVHHPLALETGVAPADRQRLKQSETSALAATRHVFVTSPATARELAQNYAVPVERLTVAVPGTEKPTTAATADNGAVAILAVGSLTRRKGHDVLLDALAKLTDLDWTAKIVGSDTLDPPLAEELSRQIDRLDLTDRVQLTGEVGDLAAFYQQADVFALASRYEGYGMVFAEALAHGLPIIACRAGAIPEVVPREAGILVDVDDSQAFSDALRHLIVDRAERIARSRASRDAGALLPDWIDTSRIFSRTLSELI